MRKACFLLWFLASPAWAGNLISSATWSESGDYKMARQDQYPGGLSANTLSRAWDGTTIKLFGAKGELLTWVTYLNASAAGDALNVMVKISSFTGTGLAAGTGFSAVQVSSTNVWDYTQRPYSLYKYSYLQQVGMSTVDIAWDPTEYDEQQLPPRWQVPCVINANNACPPTVPTQLWTNRADTNKFYPDPAVPIEEFGISSFTVSASSSQAIGGEVYISTGLIAGATYTATLTVTEGVSVSTTIPIALYVYNVTLPGTASLPVIAFMTDSDLNIRLNGTRNPANQFIDPYLTSRLRAAAFLHRHKITTIGDHPASTQHFPSVEYQKHIDGSAFKETYGLAWNTGPGYAAPDTFYMIGTYGSWQTGNWSTSTVTNGSTGYCDNVSSWTAYCTNNNIKCDLYTSDDEASGFLLSSRVNTLSTWSSTAPACAFSGHTLPFSQTGTLPTVISSAPYVNDVYSTIWIRYDPSVWIADEALYNGSSTHSASGYNSTLGVDSILAIQEEGLGPREVMWGAFKTNQRQWFIWAINYWQDTNNGGQTQNGWNANVSGDNDLFNIAKTFGYDNFPSTDASKGHTGGLFSTDGNMLYPGTDTVYANPSYGFNGVIGSWRLNMMTRGIQDADILAQANKVNPVATAALLNQQVQDVMYLRSCFFLGDCTYSYGPRPWNESLNSWETTREALLVIIQNAAPFLPGSQNKRGGLKGQGGVKFR